MSRAKGATYTSVSRAGVVQTFSGYFVQTGTTAIGDGDSGCGIAGTVAIEDQDNGGEYSRDSSGGLGQLAIVLEPMPLSDENVAALRPDLERVQREKEATEAENREYEAKLERLRRERSLSTSFDRQGGGGSADRRGTAATTTGSMWTRGMSAGGGLGQGLPYVPRDIIPKFPVKCPPYVYIDWERCFEVFITNQGLGHTISPDAPQIAVISCCCCCRGMPPPRSTIPSSLRWPPPLPAPLSPKPRPTIRACGFGGSAGVPAAGPCFAISWALRWE